jgi:hypothetical protein
MYEDEFMVQYFSKKAGKMGKREGRNEGNKKKEVILIQSCR